MNKKGFTLIEIIISIALISLISTIGIILIQKNKETKETEQKIEYVENIKLETSVYIETNKYDKKLKTLTEVGDVVYIQLKDLIASGILSEEKYNPFKKMKNKYCSYDLIKVFLNEDKNIEIEYPIGDYTEEETNKILTQVFVNIKENNDENNRVVIPDSLTVYTTMLEEVKNKKYNTSSDFEKAVQNGEYYTYKDPGCYLTDYNKQEIITNSEDWCNTVNWNNETKEWTYTYSICEDSVIKNSYDIFDNNLKRTVKLTDTSAPVVINAIDNKEATTVTLNCYYDKKSKKCDYDTYESKNGYGSSNFYTHFVYDNFDGAKYTLNSLINVNEKTNQTIILEDSNENSKSYTININAIDNHPPKIIYNAPSKGYYISRNLYSREDGNDSIYNNVNITDDIDNNITYTYDLKYIYENYISNNVYENVKEYYDSNFQFGKYKLNIKACDRYNECTNEEFDIIIVDNNEKIKDVFKDNCDEISCLIIEKMLANSMLWEQIKDNEGFVTALHTESRDLSKKLLYEVRYYDEDGVWCAKKFISAVPLLYPNDTETKAACLYYWKQEPTYSNKQ